MSISCSENGSGYTPSSIVNSFHGVPHFDIDLAQSSADFDPSLGYFESIIIWGCIPVLACVCVFILMCVYHLCVCCCCCCKEKRVRPRAVNCGCAFLISLLVLFTLGLIGAGLYSEFSLNSNILSAIDEGANINTDIRNFTTELNTFNYTQVEQSLTVLSNGLPKQGIGENVTTLIYITADIDEGISSILEPLTDAQFSSYIDDADYYEEIRHWTIVGLLVLMSVVLLITLIVSLCLTAAGAITMLIIVGVVSLIVWVLVGVGLATVLTMSDVCADPDGVARRLSNNTEAQSVVDYYIVCEDVCFPFTDDIDSVNMILGNAEVVVNEILTYINTNNVTEAVRASFSVVKDGLSTAKNLTAKAKRDLNCVKSSGIHEYYRSALNSGCEDGFVFALILFCLFSGLAVCLVVLMSCLSCYAGLLISTIKDDTEDEFVTYDIPRAATWSQRRSSYTEPYSHPNSTEEYRLTGLSRNATIEPPKYTDVGGRPTSGEYDHFDT